MLSEQDKAAVEKLNELADGNSLDIRGGRIRRSSSRFCLGVEHGDYNGTELFGVGTDRFIWMGYKPNGTNKVRIFSGNFPDDGIIEFELGKSPEPKQARNADSWARFPFGVDYVLGREGVKLSKGIDAVVYGNIPGGGMSRSASLTLNLVLSLLDANEITVEDELKIVDWAQAVENDYIGSPCGQLDQIMILFAKDGMGTHYNPKDRSISYVPLGENAPDFRILGLDTGTVRPGLEKSTYKVRRAECEELVGLLREADYGINSLAEVDDAMYEKIMDQFGEKYPGLCERLDYIFHAQKRFYEMMEAWKAGDIVTVGSIFREDGIGLRDDYKISGAELETMCNIVRTIEGSYGERMLGGGDKGASGALVEAGSVDAIRKAIDVGYPRSYPALKDKYAVHVCKVVDGIKVFEDMI